MSKSRPDPLRHGHALGFLTHHLNNARNAGDLDLQDSLKASIRELRAAPDILAALKALVDSHCQRLDAGHALLRVLSEDMAAARAAIAKAEGRS